MRNDINENYVNFQAIVIVFIVIVIVIVIETLKLCTFVKEKFNVSYILDPRQVILDPRPGTPDTRQIRLPPFSLGGSQDLL